MTPIRPTNEAERSKLWLCDQGKFVCDGKPLYKKGLFFNHSSD